MLVNIKELEQEIRDLEHVITMGLMLATTAKLSAEYQLNSSDVDEYTMKNLIDASDAFIRVAEGSLEKSSDKWINTPLRDKPVEYLGLPNRIVWALKRTGHKTVGNALDLYNRHPNHEAPLALRGIGEKSLKELEEVFRKEGLIE